MKLRGCLELAAHQKREMRILNRVLTCKASEAGRVDMITYEYDPRHATLLVPDYGVHGRSRGKTVRWDRQGFLAKNRLQGAYLPADQTRTFKSRCRSNLFIALDQPIVQFSSKEISRAMSLPTITADETLKRTRQVLPRSAEAAVVLRDSPCLQGSTDSAMRTGQRAL